MKQNKYDDPAFFKNYSQMSRSVEGLESAGEWPALRSMLPDLKGKRVLDLGCGYGWHCRYVRKQGAQSVVGIDLSEKMLRRAKDMTNDSAVTYERMGIEDIDFEAEEFDVVISSLALHYTERFDLVCQNIHHCLTTGGSFILSVEHPVFTAIAAQDWFYGPNGERLHWPVDGYQNEGQREARFLDNDVVKYHRTVATHMNALIESGFSIVKVAEPQPSQHLLKQNEDWRDETRRPMFLIISAVKN
ncbi:class I SAM-dependent methyltransferase [Evansella halocellulosilytica]|uniref:class I SAM-dependent methyltransferase n=1 Tax=Evansella halocellulosilytica TaxID=2011013 RepID=UPI000BB92CC8|nr:class I SAM-dependent methyltransferase [Evansella halocellulosilytica]